MGALANATSLRKDSTFFDWLTSAAAFTARQVILEDPTTADHKVRLQLAYDVAASPELITAQLVVLIATDPDVASIGGTPALVGESLVLNKCGAIWTTIAKMRYAPQV